MPDVVRNPHGPCFAELRGKVALVTGGGQGIGRGISRRLAAEAMHVFMCGRTEQALASNAEAIRQAGGRASFAVADVSRESDVAALFSRIREEAGTLDVLVHNAAMTDPATFAATDVAFWHRMFETNTDSCFYLAKQSAELMLPRPEQPAKPARCGGAMIFVSTIGVARAHRKLFAYDCSKGALEVFVRALAIELAEHGVRVNGIAPGPIAVFRRGHRTDLHERLYDADVPREILEHPQVPMGRSGTPMEIASVAAFLASEQASYITGQIITVDGGSVAQLTPPRSWI